MNCNGMKYHALYILESCHFILLHQQRVCVYNVGNALDCTHTQKKRSSIEHMIKIIGVDTMSTWMHQYINACKNMNDSWLESIMVEPNQFITFRKFHALIFVFLFFNLFKVFQPFSHSILFVIVHFSHFLCRFFFRCLYCFKFASRMNGMSAFN